MKAIMISIQPQWVEKILNGEKILEIRKTAPKCNFPIKVYIYCTKNNKAYLRKLKWFNNVKYITEDRDVLGETEKVKQITNGSTFIESGGLNGCVVAEFTLNTIDALWQNHKGGTSTAKVIDVDIFEKQTCMTWEQYRKYHKCKNNKYPNSYAWHIDDLTVYDEPKLLQNFFYPCDGCEKLGTNRCTEEFSYCKAKVVKPPQSWCYCEIYKEKSDERD